MPAKIIQGRDLSEQIRQRNESRVRELADKGVTVRLDAIIVGEPESGIIYARSQERKCQSIGIDYRLHTLPGNANDNELQALIDNLNSDPDVTGILLNLPLPDHLDAPAAQYAIDPYKDIEGVNPSNIGLMFYGTPINAPCTALAVHTILNEAKVELRGKNITVVGQGNGGFVDIDVGVVGTLCSAKTDYKDDGFIAVCLDSSCGQSSTVFLFANNCQSVRGTAPEFWPCGAPTDWVLTNLVATSQFAIPEEDGTWRFGLVTLDPYRMSQVDPSITDDEANLRVWRGVWMTRATLIKAGDDGRGG